MAEDAHSSSSVLAGVAPWIALFVGFSGPLYPLGVFALERHFEVKHGIGTHEAWYIATQVPLPEAVSQGFETLLAPTAVPILLIIPGVVAFSLLQPKERRPKREEKGSSEYDRTPYPPVEWLWQHVKSLLHRENVALTVALVFATVWTYRAYRGEWSGASGLPWLWPVGAILLSAIAGSFAAAAAYLASLAIFDRQRRTRARVAGSWARLPLVLLAILCIYAAALLPIPFTAGVADLPLVTVTLNRQVDGKKTFRGEFVTHADGHWAVLDHVSNETFLIADADVNAIVFGRRHSLFLNLHHRHSVNLFGDLAVTCCGVRRLRSHTVRTRWTIRNHRISDIAVNADQFTLFAGISSSEPAEELVCETGCTDSPSTIPAFGHASLIVDFQSAHVSNSPCYIRFHPQFTDDNVTAQWSLKAC